jgi:hypothetical protein
MYTHAKEYRQKIEKQVIVADGDANAEITIGNSDSVSVSTEKISDIGIMKHVLQKYFGHADTQSILIASMEQEMGAHKKKKKKDPEGDGK